MSSLQPDDRGIVAACPKCGQRNRLLYERLGVVFRCGKCQMEFPPPAEPLEVSAAGEFDSVIRRSALPVLVDFWAPWCGPCRTVAPELVKVAHQGAGRWLVVKVNTENLPDLAGRFQIRGIPTLAVFQGGKEITRQSGAMPAPAIIQFLTQAIA